MKHKIALITLLLALTVSPAFAQLGGGIVFDPTNYKNAVLRYLQLQQQLQQLQQSYNLHMQQYQFIQGQARQLQGMVGRYRAQFSQWQNLTARRYTFADANHSYDQWVTTPNLAAEIRDGPAVLLPATSASAEQAWYTGSFGHTDYYNIRDRKSVV